MRSERTHQYFLLTFGLVNIAYHCTGTSLGTSNRALSLVFDYFQKQELILSQDMKGAKQQSIQVDDKTDCIFECIATHWCRSVNFRTTPLKNSGRHVCELISSDQFTSKENITQNAAGVDHYSVKNPCERKPCQNGGECSIDDDRQDYQCKCKTGFTGKNCENDIDECKLRTHNCHVNARCTNNVGSYTCQCKTGYQGNGRSCSDIDECSSGAHDCHANARCTNNVGSYTCKCKSGFQGNGVTCSDIDECQLRTHNCHANARCTNNVGSYTCKCKSGYQGSGVTCSDIDECTSGAHNCHANALCTNNVGSYTCKCKSGFQGNGNTCLDIDECTSGAHNCHANARCTNTGGSFTCRCKVGYSGDGRTSCTEILKSMQVNSSPVCIGAKGDSYGVFKSPVNGAVKFFQMVHISGGVAYSGGAKYEGKWGDTASKLFEIHITDTNRNRIAPPANYPMNSTSSLRYSIPGQSYGASSFTFPEFSPRLIVGKDQTFWVWYGEDLANYDEANNSGTTCANVFMEYREM